MQALYLFSKNVNAKIYISQSNKEYIMELSNEDIVTKLLTSNEIIKKQKGNFYISNPLVDSLGDFLLDIDEPPVPIEPLKEPEKYVFIKQ